MSHSKKQVAGYILDKKIGRGSYATVWKGRVEASPDEAVAVKVISRQTVTETAQLRQEVEVLRRISHDNIVRFKDLKKSAAHFYLVLEYCAGGDLSQFLREKGRVDEEVARRFLTQIAAGLCVLHRENVLHRDLKPQNILLSDGSDRPVLKIADFGFARALQPQDMAATICGSPLYMAPEILRHEPYDARADLWSVGAILYELLLGRPPFSGANPMQLLANIEKHGQIMFDDVEVSAEGQEFLRALLVRNPKARLSSIEFMDHPYVRLDSRTATASAEVADPRTGKRQGEQKATPGAEAVVYSSVAGDSLTMPSDWCVPSSPCSPAGVARHEAGVSPSSGGSLAGSPVPSPLACNSPEASPRGTSVNFELSESSSPPSRDGTPATAPLQRPAPRAFAPPGRQGGEPSIFARAGGAWGDSPVGGGGASGSQQPANRGQHGGYGGEGAEEDDFVVVTAQHPVSGFARGRGPTMRAAASSFCGNLSRIAETLERLAQREQEQSPLESLALLLRALGLLEKALNVSLAEDETHEKLQQAYRRMLDAAEAVAGPVRAQSHLPCGVESLHPPARPNALVFDFAVQQAREAGVALSKGHETGGWEASCHDKLSLALLLLDLLGSEADGEDVATIASYTAAIARLATEVERRLRATEAAAEMGATSSSVLHRPQMAAAQLAGC